MKKSNDYKIANYWNMRGKTYRKSWRSVAKRRLSTIETDLVEKEIIKNKKNYNKNVKVLDVGIAIGRISEKILKYNVDLYGIDVSEVMIKYCQTKFKSNSKVKKLFIHDILNPVPSKYGKFDLISAIRVLSYTSMWKKELENIYKALNLDGITVFTFPNKYSSIFISKIIKGKGIAGGEGEVDYHRLKRVLEEIGFSEIEIVGYSRLLDSIYDLCDTKFSADLLFLFEKFLSLILGKTFMVRLFYIRCKK